MKSNSLKQNEQKLRNTFNKTMKQLKNLNRNVQNYGKRNNNTKQNSGIPTTRPRRAAPEPPKNNGTSNNKSGLGLGIF